VAISFIAFASQTSTANTSTIAKPSGTAEDDLMISVQHGIPAVNAAPSGWTALEVTTGVEVSVHYKVAGPSEPSDYTWGFTGAFRHNGFIATYRGTELATPINASAQWVDVSGSFTYGTATFPSLSPTVAEARYLGISCPSTTLSHTPDGALTERIDLSTARPVALFDEDLVVAGATGTRTATLSTTTGTLATFAIALWPLGAVPEEGGSGNFLGFFT
jgi:hypothetical protein